MQPTSRILTVSHEHLGRCRGKGRGREGAPDAEAEAVTQGSIAEKRGEILSAEEENVPGLKHVADTTFGSLLVVQVMKTRHQVAGHLNCTVAINQ